MAKIKSILFDLFGTLVIPPSHEKIVDYLIENKINYYNTEMLYWLINGLPIALCTQSLNGTVQDVRDYLLVNHFPTDNDIKQALEDRFEGVITEEDWKATLDLYQWFVSQYQLAPGAEALLRDLSTQEVKLGLISNMSQQWMEVVSRLSLDRYFDHVSLSCKAGLKKPSPIFFQEAIQNLGALPHETIVVGDSFKSDIHGARNIGSRSLWIRHTKMSRIKKLIAHFTYKKKVYCDLDTLGKKLNKTI